MERIELHLGDITQLNTEAIVNAANTSLLGGGGVDGAIHRAAGPELLKECKLLNGCNYGEAKITKGYLLNAKYIIHTVGPVWHGGNRHEEKALKSCYNQSLLLAQQHSIKSIAFPAISTGIYRFPKHQAAIIALNTVIQFIKGAAIPNEVHFCLFDEETYNIYQKLLKDQSFEDIVKV